MSDGTIGRLQAIFPELTPEHHPVLGNAPGSGVSTTGDGGQVPSVITVPIEIDPRIERMVRLAILSAPAVILVGPPGSGKTTLLRQVVDRIVADPKSFGFQVGPAGVEWSAAEENWSTTDLVGGQTIDGNELRFRPGRVLSAIADGNWLIVDEVNRADMDRIFGGLLTWLSGQDVTLGTVSPAIGSPQVQLGWSTGATCTVENEARLTDPASGSGPVRYVAGTEWRLLGTYNALDAQRVFRFGHALGRRFLRVPIPAADTEKFRTALLAQDHGLPEPLLDAIVAIYSAHLTNSMTTLGPALFLRMADYIAAGVGTDAEQLTTITHVERELLAEAYLVNVGTWLREMEDELASLGHAIVEQYHALSQAEWEWVVEMSHVLS
ncbi:AAA family ATPase [Mycolicibacterium sp. 050158]|jgi:AAA domain (dynein-related subfamily)|uniref:AAA family ATPase n=1 Tax=Mycolicibacterium sp. 050158 TaxID=3090602 RepID=UPI00299EE5EE|nr:AAA family ATPase [Mycolicibacterium sp. 050158]MDX1888140.1 AAA family ATPase [Mycolicibacterium sp. 050158]